MKMTRTIIDLKKREFVIMVICLSFFPSNILGIMAYACKSKLLLYCMKEVDISTLVVDHIYIMSSKVILIGHKVETNKKSNCLKAFF